MSQKHKNNKAKRRKERIRQDKAAGRTQAPLRAVPDKPDAPSLVYRAEDFVRHYDKPWPTISACMMVRDEAENMERVLDSVVDVVDEIIIIDTGSVDRTMDIIKEHRAWPLIKLSEEEWIAGTESDSFSLHRNHTLEKASGDWLLYIDADEELVFEDGLDVETLKIMLQNLRDDCAAVLIDLRDIREGRMVMQHTIHRLLKAGRTYFKGIVHNTLCNHNPDDTLTYCSRLIINHYGYSASEARENKFDRTEALLLKQLDMPDENLHTHFYLAQHYGMRDNAEKVIEHARAYLAKQNDPKIRGSELVAKSFFSAVYYPLAKRLLDQGKYEEIPQVIREGLQECRTDLDLLNLLSMLGMKTKNNEIILVGSEAFCDAYVSGAWKDAKMHPVFNASQEAYALNLNRLVVAALEKLCTSFKALMPVLDDLKPEDAEELINNLGVNFAQCGLFPALNVLPINLVELTEPPSPEPSFEFFRDTVFSDLELNRFNDNPAQEADQ